MALQLFFASKVEAEGDAHFLDQGLDRVFQGLGGLQACRSTLSLEALSLNPALALKFRP